LVVKDSSDEPSYVNDLESNGYVLKIREPLWYEHRMLTDQKKSVHLHVFSKGSPQIKKMLAFRDALRNDDRYRDLYAKTKKELAYKHWNCVQDYADAKSEVIEDIIKKQISCD
jgi:GrpB-like predicted nucleotidyltransferase (UPF0157 family)